MLKINIYNIFIAIILNKTIKFIFNIYQKHQSKEIKIIIISKDI